MNPEALMRRAIALSRRGFVAPNPHVGCVIVKDGAVVGEGWHKHAGGHHAEINALLAAGDRARGADVYCTLEPCNHFGRTPPCSQALIDAGVASVTVACLDPNPKAAGGLERLTAAGIRVQSGILEPEARRANEIFMTAMERRRPYVIVKAAMSADGRVALPSGESQWITGEKARREAHRLRLECGAVLVGRGTVEMDDPSLTARLPGVVNQPVRVVLDPSGRLESKHQIFDDRATTLRIVRCAIREGDLVIPSREEGFDLTALLAELYERKVIGLLVEGGPKTVWPFIKAGLVDRFELFVAPKILSAGPSWVEGELDKLSSAPRLRFDKVRKVGDDLWVTAYPAL